MKSSAEFSVHFEDAAFLEACDGLFARNQEFTIICTEESVAKCRKAADLFLRYESQRPRGRWENLKMLAKLGSAGMRAPQLMAVCNKALLLDWTVVVGNEQNQVLHLFKRSSKTTT
ncbi:hypothetical protein [Cupriavidus alkaliphilus]|uniref:hypothetical protein n=1 Tax=Cupriavidus alkaliphilus TaxID=942866 RepID=UPI000DC23857|nr:hypothetical protein [Cupriavidus alkaliphilus]MBB2917895.1 hypothetical protein [Cupriavidus alkaliphilus]RAS07043.1 hypothetical protein C7415_107292 [Cupriavidus alkaliphilus]